MGKRSHAKGSISYQFIAVPRLLIASQAWKRLPFRARALALDLMGQYTGKNNGRLCPGFEVMRRSGWTSKDQWAKAKRELLDCEFAIQTRMGHPPRTAEWLGFTWWRLDWHESMDVSATAWPFMNMVDIEQARIDPNEGRKPVNGKQFLWSATRTDRPPKRPVCGPPHGPIEAQK